MKQKRFWAFTCPTYYPCGGMGDFVKSFATIGGAHGWLRKAEANGDTNEILDTETMEIIRFYPGQTPEFQHSPVKAKS